MVFKLETEVLSFEVNVTLPCFRKVLERILTFVFEKTPQLGSEKAVCRYIVLSVSFTRGKVHWKN